MITYWPDRSAVAVAQARAAASELLIRARLAGIECAIERSKPPP